MFKVYLAGYISGNKLLKCIEWRKQIREHYDNWKGTDRYPIEWLDPLNGQLLESINDTGLKSSIPETAFIHRDYKCVKDCDLLIANLDTFGETRPLTGTIYELAWAWLEHKPTIIITSESNYLKHPFITSTASVIVKDIDELLSSKTINYFFKGSVSAIY